MYFEARHRTSNCSRGHQLFRDPVVPVEQSSLRRRTSTGNCRQTFNYFQFATWKSSFQLPVTDNVAINAERTSRVRRDCDRGGSLPCSFFADSAGPLPVRRQLSRDRSTRSPLAALSTNRSRSVCPSVRRLATFRHGKTGSHNGARSQRHHAVIISASAARRAAKYTNMQAASVDDKSLIIYRGYISYWTYQVHRVHRLVCRLILISVVFYDVNYTVCNPVINDSITQLRLLYTL